MSEPMIDDSKHFATHVAREIAQQGADAALALQSHEWTVALQAHRYSYHYSWLGLPIIQYPTDIVATHELIWQIRPDLIVETDLGRLGSLPRPLEAESQVADRSPTRDQSRVKDTS